MRAQTKDGFDFIRDGFDVDLIVELFEALCDDGRFPGTSQTLDVKHDVPTVRLFDIERQHLIAHNQFIVPCPIFEMENGVEFGFVFRANPWSRISHRTRSQSTSQSRVTQEFP